MKSDACTAEHLLNLARQKCHIKGHFEKVCRQDSTKRINKQQPVHKLEDDDEEEEEDEDDVTSVYSFKTLYNLRQWKVSTLDHCGYQRQPHPRSTK